MLEISSPVVGSWALLFSFRPAEPIMALIMVPVRNMQKDEDQLSLANVMLGPSYALHVLYLCTVYAVLAAQRMEQTRYALGTAYQLNIEKP